MLEQNPQFYRKTLEDCYAVILEFMLQSMEDLKTVNFPNLGTFRAVDRKKQVIRNEGILHGEGAPEDYDKLRVWYIKFTMNQRMFNLLNPHCPRE